MKTLPETHTHGLAHCPMCTHTVPAQIDLKGKHARVAAGQKCPRCGSSLEVAVVIHIPGGPHANGAWATIVINNDLVRVVGW